MHKYIELKKKNMYKYKKTVKLKERYVYKKNVQYR